MARKDSSGKPLVSSLRKKSQDRLQNLSVTRLIPNIATIIALCMGLSSIRFVLMNQYDYALAAILTAAFFDTLDGRLARLLGATSDFGAELDSLSDFVSFGVAPAIILYVISLKTLNGMGWSVSLIFAVCQGLRLARFNTALKASSTQSQPAWEKDFFVGIPVPASAMIALFPLEIHLATRYDFFLNPFFVAFFMIGAGILAVSRLPTFSLKNFQIPQKMVLPVMLLVGSTVAAFISDVWLTLSCLVLIYLAVIPFSVRNHRRLTLGKH